VAELQYRFGFRTLGQALCSLIWLADGSLLGSHDCGADSGDIDWRAAQITVHGKGSHNERLSLPVEVGEAIPAFLVAGDLPAGTGRSSCK
jgi:hypothetical protein